MDRIFSINCRSIFGMIMLRFEHPCTCASKQLYVARPPKTNLLFFGILRIRPNFSESSEQPPFFSEDSFSGKTQRGIHFRKQPHHVPREHCQGTKTGRVVRYSHPKATTVRRKKPQAVGMSSTRAFHSRWRVLRFSTPDPPKIPKHAKVTPLRTRESLKASKALPPSKR